MPKKSVILTFIHSTNIYCISTGHKNIKIKVLVPLFQMPQRYWELRGVSSQFQHSGLSVVVEAGMAVVGANRVELQSDLEGIEKDFLEEVMDT